MITIQTGTPPKDGRYVGFRRCDSYQAKDWCEPVIVTWEDQRWHCAFHIFGWIGPIPLAPWKDLVNSEIQEFDL